MQQVQLVVTSHNPHRERQWVEELTQVLQGMPQVRVASAAEADGPIPVLFVDARSPNLEELIARFRSRTKAIFLLCADHEELPKLYWEGKVNDVLIYPFRPAEVLSKVRHYEQVLVWDEVQEMNASFSELLEQLHDDLRLAERLQKSRLPTRFPELPGLKIANRYLAGMRSGGDYFDLAESKAASQVSFLLSDSSSYGLASAVLSVVMRVALKLSQDQASSAPETVLRIREELLQTLGEKDQLSLFYGIISRKTYELRYLNLGSSSAFLSTEGQSFTLLPSQGEALKAETMNAELHENKINLQPSDRLVIVSDGFVEAVGGVSAAVELLNQYRSQQAVDALNEWAYQVKSKLESPDDLPEQDCSAVILDVEAQVLRLAPQS